MTEPWSNICCEACWYAREDECKCRCGGKYHGQGLSKPVSDQLALSILEDIVVPKEDRWKYLVQEGVKARRNRDDVQWYLGDLALAIEKEYGSNKLGQYAEEIGVNEKTLMNYRWVSSRYENSARAEFSTLSYRHFDRVAARPDRLQLLKKAQEQSWSVRDLDSKKSFGAERNQETVNDFKPKVFNIWNFPKCDSSFGEIRVLPFKKVSVHSFLAILYLI